ERAQELRQRLAGGTGPLPGGVAADPPHRRRASPPGLEQPQPRAPDLPGLQPPTLLPPARARPLSPDPGAVAGGGVAGRRRLRPPARLHLAADPGTRRPRRQGSPGRPARHPTRHPAGDGDGDEAAGGRQPPLGGHEDQVHRPPAGVPPQPGRGDGAALGGRAPRRPAHDAVAAHRRPGQLRRGDRPRGRAGSRPRQPREEAGAAAMSDSFPQRILGLSGAVLRVARNALADPVSRLALGLNPDVAAPPDVGEAELVRLDKYRQLADPTAQDYLNAVRDISTALAAMADLAAKLRFSGDNTPPIEYVDFAVELLGLDFIRRKQPGLYHLGQMTGFITENLGLSAGTQRVTFAAIGNFFRAPGGYFAALWNSIKGVSDQT